MKHIRGGGCAIRGGGAFGYDNDGVEAAVGDAGELFFTVPKLSGGMGIGSGSGGGFGSGARESYHDDYEDDENVGFGGGSCGARPNADDDDDDNLFGG
jgi:hypothetical protein